jgi:hypothetical protein
MLISEKKIINNYYQKNGRKTKLPVKIHGVPTLEKTADWR